MPVAPEADVEVGLALVQAVEDDLDLLPVLGWLEAPLVKRELSSAWPVPSASRWNEPVGARSRVFTQHEKR